MKPIAFLVLALLPAFAPAPDPQKELKSVVAAAREGLEALSLPEKDLRTRADFLAADAHRLAIVDRSLEAPLAVPVEAWTRFSPWIGPVPTGVEGRLRLALETLLAKVPAEPPVPKAEDLVAAVLSLHEGRGGTPPDRATIEKSLAPVPKGARPALTRLLLALDVAARERTAAFSGLSESEWVRLRQYGSQLNTGAPVEMQADMMGNLHARVDRRRVFAAALPLAREIDAIAGSVASLSGGEAFHVILETPAGRVEIGGWGANRYEEDSFLTFDLGGDDVYTGCAGGTLYTPLKTALCVDLSGDDVYRTTVGLAQGSGAYGVGMLVDLAGDDVFESLNVSQGSGHLGVGVLFDAGGDDRYVARSVSQGAGFQGIGLLIDEEGRDVYRLGLLGQGLGLTEGFGVLLDRAGDDAYRAGGVVPDEPREPGRFLSLAQGFGQGRRADAQDLCASGGIGLLADAAGDDDYEADVFGQGGAYWFALGVLLDGAGNDRYDVHNYGQGAGIHMAVGLHFDLAGDDRYLGAGHALGHGLDRGFGCFADFSGDDCYESRDGESQGAAVKPFAVALFADIAGDDLYRGGGLGYVRSPEEGPDGPWPKAFFLDLGGRDRYEVEGTGAADGRTWEKDGHGIGSDR